MKRNSTFAGRFALTGVAAAALCLVQPEVWALGLGRLQVQSALGESLRAEIDVTSLTPEEAANLRVRIAAPEAYRTAGVEYNPVLPTADVSLQRRADGRPYLRLTSNRGVQEPFVDVILDLSWSTGRLVREYTLLFDPPATARSTGSASTTVSNAAPAPVPGQTLTLPAAGPMIAAAPVPPVDSAATGGPPPERRSRVRPAPVYAQSAPAAPMSPATTTSATTNATSRPPTARAAVTAAGKSEYRVRPGDSLSRIASRTQPPGVSLDQMLVSLFRSNPDAFIGSNMNRLRSGAVLSVPGADAANAVTPDDARQVIQAQSADFGAYRQRLASGVPTARTEASNRKLSGKLQATVTDNSVSAAPAPDKLTLSKGAAEEQRISRDREKKSADVRVAELSKNVDELKKLSSAASQPASAAVPAARPAVAPPPVVVAVAPPAPAPTPAPVAPAAPVVSAQTQPSAPAAGAGPAPAPAVLAPAVLPAAVVTSTSPAASAALASASSALATASAPRATPEPTSSGEPGLFGSMFDDNPVALGVGALLLLALGGFAAYRFSARSKRDSGETSFLESRLQPDSFFGASGGQHIDTRDAGGASSSMSYSLSQLDAIGDVDPVAEADVYLAYGRDLQAEEILKEAMRSNPDRLAIRTKLLEVYAKRRDTKGFELLATQLFALTQGVGDDWNKAQELGQQIDPENPLYRPGGGPALASNESGQVIEPLGASTMPQSVLPTPSHFTATDSGHGDLGLDLDLGDPDTGMPTAPSPLEMTEAFNAPTPRHPAPGGVSPPESEHDAMLLDFSMPDLGVPEASGTPAFATSSSARSDAPMPFDLSKISFDLDDEQHPAARDDVTTPSPQPSHASESGAFDLSAADGADGKIAENDPLARKLELAEEFRQIGDTDGARDLLQEVVAKAGGAVKSRAQAMLAGLG